MKGSSWIGASDQMLEDRWVWYANGDVFWNGGTVDGKFSNWQAAQPNDNGALAAGEDCAVILSSPMLLGQWNDLSCEVSGFRAACESLDPVP